MPIREGVLAVLALAVMVFAGCGEQRHFSREEASSDVSADDLDAIAVARRNPDVIRLLNGERLNFSVIPDRLEPDEDLAGYHVRDEYCHNQVVVEVMDDDLDELDRKRTYEVDVMVDAAKRIAQTVSITRFEPNGEIGLDVAPTPAPEPTPCLDSTVPKGDRDE